MKRFLVKSIPLLLAFVAGITVFLTAMFILQNGNLYDIFIEISGALIGIPFVFFIYDYTEYRVSRKLNKTFFDHIRFDIDTIVSDILHEIQANLNIKKPLDTAMIQKMTDMKVADIKRTLRPRREAAPVLRGAAGRLSAIIYRGANVSVLNHDMLQNILVMSKEATLAAGTIAHGGRGIDTAVHLQKLLDTIDAWYDAIQAEEIGNR